MEYVDSEILYYKCALLLVLPRGTGAHTFLELWHQLFFFYLETILVCEIKSLRHSGT